MQDLVWGVGLGSGLGKVLKWQKMEYELHTDSLG